MTGDDSVSAAIKAVVVNSSTSNTISSTCLRAVEPDSTPPPLPCTLVSAAFPATGIEPRRPPSCCDAWAQVDLPLPASAPAPVPVVEGEGLEETRQICVVDHQDAECQTSLEEGAGIGMEVGVEVETGVEAGVEVEKEGKDGIEKENEKNGGEQKRKEQDLVVEEPQPSLATASTQTEERSDPTAATAEHRLVDVGVQAGVVNVDAFVQAICEEPVHDDPLPAPVTSSNAAASVQQEEMHRLATRCEVGGSSLLGMAQLSPVIFLLSSSPSSLPPPFVSFPSSPFFPVPPPRCWRKTTRDSNRRRRTSSCCTVARQQRPDS